MRTIILLLLAFFSVESFAAPCETCPAHTKGKKSKVVMKKKVVKKKSAKDSTTIKIGDNPRHFPPPGSSGQGRNTDFYYKRAFPNATIDPQLYLDALEQAKKLPVYRPRGGQTQQADMKWQAIGPYTIGGRVTSLATHPTDSNLFYVGAAAGGLWKTTDHGNSWKSLTDTFAFLSVGCVTLDPHNPNVIYLGLGESNNSADSYPGNGVWRSLDAGESWTSLGLAKTQYITKIIVDPKDSNIVYVASPGPPAGADSNRGVWKSVDRGLTWTRSFFLRAGATKTSTPVPVVDLVMNPLDEKQLVVCTWDKHSPTSGGLYTSLWLTKDAGITWNRIDTLSPTYPSGAHRGRFSRGSLHWGTNSKGVPTLYSVITKVDTNAVTKALSDDNLFGIYKTTTPEGEWIKVLDSTYRIPYRGNNVDSADLFYRQGSYNNFITGHPTRPDEVYVGGIDVIRTTDGGITWINITKSYPAYFNNDRRQHSDQHALAFTAAKNGNDLLDGSDGGVFHTLDFGTSWTQMKGLPITMFYHLEPWNAGMTHLGDNFPADSIKLMGGTQDNGTLAHGFSANPDWDWVNRGDGGHAQTDPSNKNRLVTSLQLGKIFVRTTLDSLRPNLFSDNGNNDPNTKKWFDLSTIAKRRGITDSSEPCSFIPPVVLDKQRPTELYSGRTHVYHSRIDYSDPDSGTIIQRWSPQIVGVTNEPKTWVYGAVIEALGLGARDENGRPMIWAGGISATRDGGGGLSGATSLWRTTYDPSLHADSIPRWVKKSTGLPFAITSALVCDRSDSLTAFAGMSSYNATRHLYKTTNGGTSWTHISGTAPYALPNAPLSAIVIDSLAEQGNPAAKNQCIIVAMDVGVFVTTDGGKKWERLGTGMPNQVVNSVTMYKNWLIAGTHGRGAWALDVSSLRAVPLGVRNADAKNNLSVVIESVYPNPLTIGMQQNTVTLRVQSKSGNSIQKIGVDILHAASGVVALHRDLELIGTSEQIQLDLPPTLASGTYIIRVSDTSGGHDEKQLIVVQ